jgi:hypothetical protein
MRRTKDSIHWVVIGLVLLVLVPAGLVFLANQDGDEVPVKVEAPQKMRLKDRSDIVSR